MKHNCKRSMKLMTSPKELSFAKRFFLKLHLLMCDKCSRYQAHLNSLGDHFRTYLKSKEESSQEKVTSLEDEIIKSLSKDQ